MNLLKFFLKEAPEKTIHILILSLIAGMSEVASVLLTINGAQDVAAGKNYMLYTILLPTAALLFILSKRISQTRAASLMESILEKLYTNIANDIRHAELPEIEALNTAQIYLKMLNAQTITDAATKGIHTSQSLFAVFFLWIYVFWISPVGGILSLLIFALATGVYEIMQNQATSLIREETEKEKELADLFDHILYGAKEIRISQRKNDDLFANHLVPIISQVKDTRTRILSYFSKYSIFTFACFFISLAGVGFFFPRFYSNETAISVLVIGFYVWVPLFMILSTLPEITQGKAAIDDLYRLAREDRITRETGEYIYNPLKEQTEKFTDITLDHVEFVYKSRAEESGFPVGPVSFTGRAGELIFIAGGNGSGKTTLMKILTGLYPHDSGEIKINGKPVKISEHRHLFSTVFSDFHLFDAIYGTGNIDVKTVQKLLMKTELSHKTQWIPDQKRFSTTHLSAGQRKRLALVASLIEDKSIYVFDEWAADQDPYFRKYFYETLLPSMKEQGKLVIVVSHDDRYFHIGDRLIRMEYGRMVSCTGPCDDLPAQEQIAKETFSGHQTNGQEEPKENDWDRKSSFGSGKNRAKKKRNRITEMLLPSARDRLGGLIFNGILCVICSPILVGIIFTAANLAYGESETRLFLLFLITILLYLISYKRFCNPMIYLIQDRIARIRLKVMEQIRNTHFYSFEKTGIEKIRTALTYDMKSVSEISNSLVFGSKVMLSFIGYIVFIAVLSRTAFFVAIGVIAVGSAIFTYNQVMVRKIIYQVREGEKKLFDAVTDILDGFKELRLNSRKSDEFFHTSFKTNCSQLKNLKLKAAKRFIDIYTIACSLWQMLFIFVVLIIPLTCLISANTLMTLVGVIICLPINSLFINYIPSITLSSISIQRLYELGEELDNLKEESTAVKDAYMEFDEIRYQNISFQYEENSEHGFFVGPLNMRFRSGEITFIVGGNGSGKSTLLNLLTGLYPLQSGQVFLNQVEMEITRCKSLFSVIFYDFHLFDRLYGLKNVDKQRVNHLLRLMQLDHKVQFDGDRFSTLDLSTGQRKRLAMVAAIMEDKPIYVFDEWAADQDPHFRKYFYETLLPSFKAQGKTIIAVTHDDRYFHVADRVINLEYGRIR